LCEENCQLVFWVDQNATAYDIPCLFQFRSNDAGRECKAMALSGKKVVIKIPIYNWETNRIGIGIWRPANPSEWRNFSIREANLTPNKLLYFFNFVNNTT
jgi:hypothetical protein